MLREFDFQLFENEYSFLHEVSLSSLGKELAQLQRELLETDKRLIIMIDGWESSQKGYLLRKIVQDMDPRYYEVTSFDEFGRDEITEPYLTQFVNFTPTEGHTAVFSRSFYHPLFRDLQLNRETLRQYIEDFQSIEKVLTRDNTLFIKLFTHHSEKTMAKRIKDLENDPARDVLINAQDYFQLENYAAYLDHMHNVLNTKSEKGETSDWKVLSTENPKIAAKAALYYIIDQLKRYLKDEIPVNQSANLPDLPKKDKVLHVDLSKSIEMEEYEGLLDSLQEEAGNLAFQLYKKQKNVIVIFEGIDAAGKGGTIERLTRKMDPRSRDIATVAAPTKTERSYSYLWRFYRDFPRKGHITIFDRSWYGRVLIERVEQLTPAWRINQAYEEINEMEHNLIHHDGILIIKFLLLIDKDTQYKRFMDRKNVPEKRHKLTEADWRSHMNFDKYIAAMNDMVNYTDTSDAPWHVIPSVDKKYARIQALEIFNSEVRHYLKEEKS